MTTTLGIEYAQTDGFRPLCLDLRTPAVPEPPVVVFLHGGGWLRGTRGAFTPGLSDAQSFDRLVDAGFAVASCDYRLSGEAHFPAQLEDVDAAVNWLHAHGPEYGVDSSRMVLWGVSAGATLAALTALRRSDVRGVVDWFGPSDLFAMAEHDTGDAPEDTREARWLGGTAETLPGLARAASPALQAHATAPPFHISHGTHDEHVPFAQSEALAAALRREGADVEFHPVDGGQHFWLGVDDTAPLFDRAIDFIRRATASPGPIGLNRRERKKSMRTDIHDVTLEGGGHGFRVRVYPAAQPNGAMLVWLHGGAFMFGTLEMPEGDQVARRLSAAGTTVVSVDYTLAPLDALEALAPPSEDPGFPSPEQLRAEAEAAGPRARFPVASLQIVEAFDWAVEHAKQFGALSDQVALGGASAGANLSTGAAMRLRDRGTTAPALLALVYPSLHDAILPPNDELARLLQDVPPTRIFTPESRDAINRNYLPDGNDPFGYAFPGGHDLAGLPPVLVVNAELDSLRASGEAFAAELARASVDVHVVRQRGAMHGYLNEIGHPAAERTLALLADAVEQTIRDGARS